MNRFRIAILASALFFGLAASPNTPTSDIDCYGGAGGGCVYVQGGGLYVNSVQAGVDGPFVNKCGYYKVGQQNPGGSLNVIHTSSYRCLTLTALERDWGPYWVQNQNYADGTKFSGWFSPYYGKKGVVTING